MVDLKYIGHSAFEIKNGDSAVLIDPLVSVNKKYKWKGKVILPGQYAIQPVCLSGGRCYPGRQLVVRHRAQQ